MRATIATRCSQTLSSQAAQGSLLYLCLYAGVFLPFQSFSKFYILGKKRQEAKLKDSKERISLKDVKYYSRDVMALRGDRTVGNYIEQGFYFFPLFWMYAIFVDPSQSFAVAVTYTASRALYPFVYGAKKPMLVLISTVPGYMVHIYLLIGLTKELCL